MHRKLERVHYEIRDPRIRFEDIGGRYLSEMKWAAWFPAP